MRWPLHLLLVIPIALTVGCSSCTDPGTDGDGGAAAGEDAAVASSSSSAARSSSSFPSSSAGESSSWAASSSAGVSSSSSALVDAGTPDAGTPDAAAPPDAAVPAVCGNGIQEGTEQCDEGTDNGGYGRCSGECTRPRFPPEGAPGTVPAAWLEQPPACTEGDWMVKYLHYRLRLRGNGTAQYPGFLSVGPDHGQSIPASMRDPLANCANDYFVTAGHCWEHDQADAQGSLGWGDATVWLGHYLAVLATEHAAFRAVGLPTTQTEEDLYYALNAFNRVDEEAEAFFAAPPARDGFFIRDDVRREFFLDGDGGYRFPRSDGTNLGYECITSTEGCGLPNTRDGYFTSQDQVNGMIWGLGLVVNLVPSAVTSHGVALRQEARGEVHRMVNHVRSHGWKVVDPVGESPPDAWGGNAIGTSYTMAAAANALCAPDFGIPDYQDAASRTLGWTAFQALQAGWNLTHSYNHTMVFDTLPFTDIWNLDTMSAWAVQDDREVFALAQALVHHVPPSPVVSAWRMEGILTSAPCGGPCFGTPGCSNTPGWEGESRAEYPSQRMSNVNRPRAEYNGMDYMMLHNLWLLTRHGQYGFLLPEEPPPEQCSRYRGLDTLLTEGPQDGEFYDPADACAAADLGRNFCGRSWASWLDQAYRQEVVINVAGGRLACLGQGPCTLHLSPLEGWEGVDLILGTPGPDVIRGNTGDDCLYGMDGDDVLVGGVGRDELHGGNGNDTLHGDEPGATDGDGDTLFGEDGNDELHGGPATDELFGGAGNDTLDCGDGDDFADGQEDDDEIRGGPGDDVLFGGSGNDHLQGDDGDDYMLGGPGKDRMDGNAGLDSLHGEEGNDFLRGGAGADSLVGDDGADRLCSGDDDDTIWGDWSGTDTCNGGGGTNNINGCNNGSASDSDCGDGAFAAW